MVFKHLRDFTIRVISMKSVKSPEIRVISMKSNDFEISYTIFEVSDPSEIIVMRGDTP